MDALMDETLPLLPVLDDGSALTVETLIQVADKMLPMPRVVQRALKMLSKNDSLHSIGQTLSTDASVAATLLRLANSSFYRTANEVRDVPSAVVRVGSKQLKEVLLALTVMRPSRPEPRIAAELRSRMMVHSASARVIALYLDDVDADTAFLTGLFCDVGQLLFTLAAGRSYTPLYQRWQEEGTPMSRLEDTWAGFDHAHLGSKLLWKWEVPEAVSKGVAHHHDVAEFLLEEDRTALGVASAVSMAQDIALAIREQRPMESVSVEALSNHEAQVFLGFDEVTLEKLVDECKQAAFELGAVFTG